MKIELIVTLTAIPVMGGILLARLYTRRRERRLVASRLARWSAGETPSQRPLLKRRLFADDKFAERLLGRIVENKALQNVLAQSGFQANLVSILQIMACLFAIPIVAGLALGQDLSMPFLAGILLSLMPFIVIKIKAGMQRNKFHDQLPDAIDLMVAVLRSGHSIPQAVQAVAQEIPAPCGGEFNTILQRMNLGQPLAESMLISASRFDSEDLDLIRRAVAIQLEVGGSLAELLDKTNSTLRQRLKLKRQLRILTAQSRLTATIVGLLPVALAVGLDIISPGYMELLINDNLGRILIIAAIALEAAGLFIMHKMSTMRV